MRLASALLVISAAVFAVVGIAYLVSPGAMLGVAGVESAPTSDFLLRTEGVALVTGAGLIYAVIRSNRASSARIALIALAAYYLLGSLVDLSAFRDGVVGATSLPGILARLVFGAACVFAAMTYAAPASSR